MLKGIVRKVETRESTAPSVVSGIPVSPIAAGSISTLSRPGSAYVRVAIDPTRPPTAALDRSGRAIGGYAALARVGTPTGSVAAGLRRVDSGLSTGSGGGAPSPLASGYGPVDPLAGTDVLGGGGSTGGGAFFGGSSRPPLPRKDPSLSSLQL